MTKGNNGKGGDFATTVAAAAASDAEIARLNDKRVATDLAARKARAEAEAAEKANRQMAPEGAVPLTEEDLDELARARGKLNGGRDPVSAMEPKNRFPLIAFDDIKMSTTNIYLVKGLIPATGIVVIWGPPKCGKSFWLLDLLMHVALCALFSPIYRGRRVKGGAVVFIELEGQEGFMRRVDAYRRHHKTPKGVPFYLMTAPLNLIEDHLALISAIRAQLPEGVEPVAIAIDTLNRSLVGSESDDKDMSAYFRAAEALGAAFKCVIPIIHHCGHNGERPRGHSSLGGTVVAQIAVKGGLGAPIIATLEASKDDISGATFVSRLLVVDLEPDPDGDMVTSCVIEEIEEDAVAAAATAKGKSRQRLSPRQERALDALVGICIGADTMPPPAILNLSSSVRAVKVDAWFHELRRGVLADVDKSPNVFTKLKDALAARKLIGERDGLVWPAL